MERTPIKIGKKAQTVLKGISCICQSLIIRNDYFYTKYEASPEEKNKKGSLNVVVEYTLPEGEVQIETEFGIFDTDEFLKVIGSFEDSSLKLELEGNAIHIKDSRKKTTYYTQSTMTMPTKPAQGDTLFDSGEVAIGMILSEVDIEQIKKDLSVLPFDELSLKGEGEKVVKLIAGNKVTSNGTEIKMNEEFVAKSEEDFEFIFPNVDIFSLVVPDSYSLVVKKINYNGRIIKICRLQAKTLEGLKYTLISA